MLSPAAMLKLRLIVLERDVALVTQVLGELGVVHLRSSVEAGEGRLVPEVVGEQLTRCRALAGRLDSLMERLGVSAGPLAPVRRQQTALDQVEAFVSSLEERAARPSQELRATGQAVADTEELLRDLTPYRDIRGSLRPLAESAFLELKAGRVASADLERMRGAMPEGILIIPLGERLGQEVEAVELLVVSGRRRRFAMETVLGTHGFEERRAPAWEDQTPADVYAEATRRKLSLQAKQQAVVAELHTLGEPNAQALREAARAVSTQLQLSEAAQKFGATWATAVISGWVPEAGADGLRQAVMEAIGGRAVIEFARPDAEDIEAGRVPSYVVHHRFLEPFEGMVRGYGVASYQEIEPTVLFAASFLLMFGVIFGDLGHGFCLLVIGLATRRMAKQKSVRDVGFVITAAGLASMLFGAFFQGSFFGKSLRDMGFPLTLGFKPIRFEGAGPSPTHYVTRYLVLAIVLGIVLISLGAILNIVNRLRRGDYGGGLLGQFGVVGIIFYWGALALAIKVVVSGVGPADVWLAVAAIGLPLVILVLHEPIYALLTWRRPIWKESALAGIFMGVVEGMETVMMYVANTFSFLRVAAFALSHAALCFTIFVLERLVDGLPGGVIWSAAVFLLGTGVIIGLEGLIVTIQIMRLEYYEFFTKFFGGEGVRYEPFRLT